jgi:very-short-patch-repair endonuclease
MGVDERPFDDKPGLRPVVWRVSVALRTPADKSEQPARVCHRLVVDERGDRGLAEVAGAQRGLVCLSQLGELGIGRSAMRHRVAKGALHVVLPSVWAVGAPVLQPLGAETAALLYAGDDAVISHDSAAALWGLTASPSFVAITMMGRNIKPQPGVRVYRVKALDIRDVRIHQGFPVTEPARTLIDCAAGPMIDQLLNEARALGLVTDRQVHEAMDRCRGRKGTGPLRKLLEAEVDSGYTASKAERRLRRLVKEADIEKPVFNLTIEGLRVDALWRRWRLVVEIDGYLAHGRRQAFERDRERDARLVRAGYIVLRFTWRQLTHRPAAVAVTVARTLARLEAQAA